MEQKEVRQVGRFEQRDEKGRLLLVIDTSLVYDSIFPYETAIASLEYNRGEWIVTQCYSSREAACTGHREWVKRMRTGTLPDQLVDVSGSRISDLADESLEGWRIRPRHEPGEPSVVSYLWLAQDVKTLVQETGPCRTIKDDTN